MSHGLVFRVWVMDARNFWPGRVGRTHISDLLFKEDIRKACSFIRHIFVVDAAHFLPKIDDRADVFEVTGVDPFVMDRGITFPANEILNMIGTMVQCRDGCVLFDCDSFGGKDEVDVERFLIFRSFNTET